MTIGEAFLTSILSRLKFVCKGKEAHTIAEELLKPCAMEKTEIALCAEAQKKLQQVPLTKDLILPGVHDMSHHILQNVAKHMTGSPIKVDNQLDESTDIDGYSLYKICDQLLYLI